MKLSTNTSIMFTIDHDPRDTLGSWLRSRSSTLNFSLKIIFLYLGGWGAVEVPSTKISVKQKVKIKIKLWDVN